MRVAIVHDWLNGMRGGEKVLEELAIHHHEELQNAAPGLVAALRRVMAGKKETVRREVVEKEV